MHTMRFWVPFNIPGTTCSCFVLNKFYADQSRVILAGIKHRCCHPTCVGSIRSHAFGYDAKAGCMACLGRELQATPFAQIHGPRDLGDNKGNDATSKSFFSYRKGTCLIRCPCDENVGRIKERQQTLWIDGNAFPPFVNPKNRLFLWCGKGGKDHGAWPVNFVNTRDFGRENIFETRHCEIIT